MHKRSPLIIFLFAVSLLACSLTDLTREGGMQNPERVLQTPTGTRGFDIDIIPALKTVNSIPNPFFSPSATPTVGR